MKFLSLSPKVKNLFVVGIVIGILCFGISLAISPSRAWHGYILNYYYFMCLGLGGCFFAATQHLTNAGWSSTIRRIPEALNSWFLPALILFIPIFFGGHDVYQWMSQAKIDADPLLKMKTGYLNMPFFVIRFVVLFAVWYLVGGQMIRNSLKQDVEGGVRLTSLNVKLSALFIPLFALSFTFISFDLLMSLDPHWYSTMFGVNCFANLFLSTIAVSTIITLHMKKAGYFGETVTETHTQFLGLLLFAFVIFYAYIAFSQYMLIWYGNLPEETSFYLRRWQSGWSVYAMVVLIFKFIVPFLMLLPFRAKRNMSYLLGMAYLVVIANWIDLFWMVMPAYSETKPLWPFLEFGIFLGFAGAFGLTVTRFLSRNPIQPQKDPRVQEALHLH